MCEHVRIVTSCDAAVEALQRLSSVSALNSTELRKYLQTRRRVDELSSLQLLLLVVMSGEDMYCRSLYSKGESPTLHSDDGCAFVDLLDPSIDMGVRIAGE
jgi:hypothetical protein